MHSKALVCGILALAIWLVPVALNAQPTTTMLSRENPLEGWAKVSGAEGPGESVFLSSDGRYSAFVTDVANLFDGQDAPRGFPAIAVRDQLTGSMSAVTVSTDGRAPNGPSFAPTVSTDGRYVCFCSWASNLVPDDNNGQGDIFVRDMQAQTTRRVNVPYDGVWDQSEKSYCVTHAMTDDGRYVVFSTTSGHMVANDTNDSDDVFLRDLAANKTYLVSVATDGGPANGSSIEPRIARNGRYVVFMSLASNLAPNTATPGMRTFVRDTDPAHLATTLVGDGGLPFISATGRYVSYTSLAMTGEDAQVYRYDAQTGQKVLCSVAPNGSTLGNRDSISHSVSDDGRYVCFSSKARNLVTDDTNDEADVFIRDLGAVPAATARISVAKDGLQGHRASGNADMSSDGCFVAFTSATEDLVSLDNNEDADVFLRGPLFTRTFRLTDAVNAVRVAAGRAAATPSDAALDVDRSGLSSGRIDLLDATRIARSATGLN